jgi:uncharacterized protein YpmS
MHSIFDPAQTYQSEVMTPGDVYHQTQVIKRLTQLLWQSEPGKICVLELTPQEVNALIIAISNSDSIGDFLLSARQVGAEPKKRPYKVVFKGDRFDIKYSLPTEFNTPFGENINLQISGTPALDQKNLNIDVKAFSAGDIALPPAQVEKILKTLLKKYQNDKTFKRIREVVVKACITKDNNLIIYFYPYRIRNCLTEGF